MKKTLQVLNELETGGFLERYAIGGAVAAIFYAEAIATYDLDVFVILPESGGLLVSLAPLYDELKRRGYTEEAECVVIEGVPVQFLPAFNPLVGEALAGARQTLYEDIPTRVLAPEYLLAIMLQTGRSKDRQRFAAFLEQAVVFDPDLLREIAERHSLEAKLEAWTRQTQT